MRQAVAFSNALQTRNTKKEYYRFAFMAKLQNVEIASLEEVLGVASNEETTFDAKTNQALDDRAKALLKETHVRRSTDKSKRRR